MKNKEFLAKMAALGVAVVPMSAWSQDQSGLVPRRLDIGEATGEGGVKLTEKGQVLPGDLGTAIPDNLEPEDAVAAERKKILDSLPESVRRLDQAKQFEIGPAPGRGIDVHPGDPPCREGLDRLIRIEAISPDLYQTYNLRGAIYTKLRSFDKARAAFERSLELQPNVIESSFNLAELDFVEKKFPEAEAAFRKLGEDFARHFERSPETGKLVEYKLFISVLMQSEAPGDSKEKEALAMLETFDYLDDYPVYYYSQAALAFFRDNKEEAEEWLASAAKIYSKPVQTIYVDALVEMGWVDAL